jgi:putative two-component system response regulator
MQDINLQSQLDRTLLDTLRCASTTNSTPPTSTMSAPLVLGAAGSAPSQTAKVMIVDDDPLNVTVVQKHLMLVGYEHFVTTTDPRLVMELITQEMPDVILLDVMMPIVSGLEILQKVHDDQRLTHIPTIVLTVSDNEQIRTEALELGATEFLSKPVIAAELILRVRNALLVKAQEHQLRLRTSELAASRLELIHCLTRVAEYRDSETGSHVVRVGRYAEIIARQLGLDEPTVELIGRTAPLHDMGKVGIPDGILLKPGKLAPDEIEIMQKHSVYGKHAFEPMSYDEGRTYRSHTFLGEMIMDVNTSPYITMAATIALSHHEKWDGTGYPAGLSGEGIPLAGRITAVADVFDALSNKRPYKPAFPISRCLNIIKEESGTHFDPAVVDAFLSCREAIVQVRMEYADVE